MDTLFHRFADKIKGILIGFDRIVFKGTIQNICYPKGIEMFLNGHGVLNKDYKDWLTKQSAVIIKDAEDYAKNQTGKKIQYIASSNVRKETVAHEEQKTLGIQEGLIGVWSCVEACNTFKATFDSEKGYPQIKSEKSRCLHLYFYYDHKDYGFRQSEINNEPISLLNMCCRERREYHIKIHNTKKNNVKQNKHR